MLNVSELTKDELATTNMGEPLSDLLVESKKGNLDGGWTDNMSQLELESYAKQMQQVQTEKAQLLHLLAELEDSTDEISLCGLCSSRM